MGIRKIVIMSFMLLSACGLSAQSVHNARLYTVVDKVDYTPKKQTVLGVIADVLVTGQATTDNPEYVSSVRAAIVKGLSSSHRMSVIDGQTDASMGHVSPAYYVDATISNMSTTTKTEVVDEKKKTKRTLYKTLIGVTLHVKDAHSGEVVASPQITVSDLDMLWLESAAKSMNSSLAKLAGSVCGYFNRFAPLYANIVEGARDKNDKQKEVYIDLGEKDGVYSGLHFNVYTVKTVAGKEAKKQIGRLKISEVQGDDLSLCKVQSGGKDIKAAIDGGETISVRSSD